MLFYTNGQTVWNRFHEIMPNGSGLMGDYSSTQSSIIIPSPNEPDRYYYIFCVGEGLLSQKQATYSLVDICLDNGKGDVISNEKNILLGDSLPEKMCVTRHANGNDYWILTHKFGTNDFWAFKLSESGVTDTIVSSAGSTITNWAATFGQMKFSTNGQRIAFGASNVQSILEILDFDNSSGIVSNAKDLYAPNNDQFCTYGLEFSPDNSKLYVKGYSLTGPLTTYIVQYDLNAGNENLDSINASLYVLLQIPGLISGGAMQLGPNGIIYSPSTQNSNYISSINYPNLYGSSCQYVENSIYLSGRNVSYGLPCIISNFDYSNKISPCTATEGIELEKQKEDLIQITPNPFSDLLLIDLKIDVFQEITLQILNLQGSIEYNVEINTAKTSIDLSNLNAGLYYIIIIDRNSVYHKEIIKY
jgi:large repetitive protein